MLWSVKKSLSFIKMEEREIDSAYLDKYFDEFQETEEIFVVNQNKLIGILTKGSHTDINRNCKRVYESETAYKTVMELFKDYQTINKIPVIDVNGNLLYIYQKTARTNSIGKKWLEVGKRLKEMKQLGCSIDERVWECDKNSKILLWGDRRYIKEMFDLPRTSNCNYVITDHIYGSDLIDEDVSLLIPVLEEYEQELALEVERLKLTGKELELSENNAFIYFGNPQKLVRVVPIDLFLEAYPFQDFLDSIQNLNKYGVKTYYFGECNVNNCEGIADGEYNPLVADCVTPELNDSYSNWLKKLYRDRYTKDYREKVNIYPKVYENYLGEIWFEELNSEFVNYRKGYRITTDTPAIYRNTIYILGRSTMQGVLIEDKDTMPSQLQKLVNNAKKPYRVVNYGYSGISIDQMLVKLKNISF